MKNSLKRTCKLICIGLALLQSAQASQREESSESYRKAELNFDNCRIPQDQKTLITSKADYKPCLIFWDFDFKLYQSKFSKSAFTIIHSLEAAKTDQLKSYLTFLAYLNYNKSPVFTEKDRINFFEKHRRQILKEKSFSFLLHKGSTQTQKHEVGLDKPPTLEKNFNGIDEILTSKNALWRAPYKYQDVILNLQGSLPNIDNQVFPLLRKFTKANTTSVFQEPRVEQKVFEHIFQINPLVIFNDYNLVKKLSITQFKRLKAFSLPLRDKFYTNPNLTKNENKLLEVNKTIFLRILSKEMAIARTQLPIFFKELQTGKNLLTLGFHLHSTYQNKTNPINLYTQRAYYFLRKNMPLFPPKRIGKNKSFRKSQSTTIQLSKHIKELIQSAKDLEIVANEKMFNKESYCKSQRFYKRSYDTSQMDIKRCQVCNCDRKRFFSNRIGDAKALDNFLDILNNDDLNYLVSLHPTNSEVLMNADLNAAIIDKFLAVNKAKEKQDLPSLSKPHTALMPIDYSRWLRLEKLYPGYFKTLNLWNAKKEVANQLYNQQDIKIYLYPKDMKPTNKELWKEAIVKSPNIVKRYLNSAYKKDIIKAFTHFYKNDGNFQYQFLFYTDLLESIGIKTIFTKYRSPNTNTSAQSECLVLGVNGIKLKIKPKDSKSLKTCESKLEQLFKQKAFQCPSKFTLSTQARGYHRGIWTASGHYQTLKIKDCFKRNKHLLKERIEYIGSSHFDAISAESIQDMKTGSFRTKCKNLFTSKKCKLTVHNQKVDITVSKDLKMMTIENLPLDSFLLYNLRTIGTINKAGPSWQDFYTLKSHKLIQNRYLTGTYFSQGNRLRKVSYNYLRKPSFITYQLFDNHKLNEKRPIREIMTKAIPVVNDRFYLDPFSSEKPVLITTKERKINIIPPLRIDERLRKSNFEENSSNQAGKQRYAPQFFESKPKGKIYWNYAKLCNQINAPKKQRVNTIKVNIKNIKASKVYKSSSIEINCNDVRSLKYGKCEYLEARSTGRMISLNKINHIFDKVTRKKQCFTSLKSFSQKLNRCAITQKDYKGVPSALITWSNRNGTEVLPVISDCNKAGLK